MFSDTDLLFRVPEKSVLEGVSGEFARNVALLVLAEPEFPGNWPFLTKVLAAAQLNLEKDTLFAEIHPDDRVTFLPLIKEKHPGHILVFGLLPNQLGFNIDMPLYQPQHFYGSAFLFADRLSTLEPDKALKAKLWQALRLLFL